MNGDRKRLGERGATAVFVAIALASLLGMVALGVDVGMLMKVRSDAQRTADAAALAGAQDFFNGNPQAVKATALNHALEYASRNYVGWKYVDTSGVIIRDSGARYVGNSPEAYVQVMPDTQKVRVFIRREATATWFGSLFRIPFVRITVKAAAQVVTSGTGKCVKPLDMTDLWNETNTTTQDKNANRAWDTNEVWQYNTAQGDRYADYNPSPSPDSTPVAQQTGYGSAWRNNNGDGVVNDYGRLITIKAQSPKKAIASGFFYPWRMPLADGTTASGANDYKNLLSDTTCTVAGPVSPGTTYRVENGNMVGPTKQGINNLLSYDPGAYWDPNYPDGQGHTGAVRGSKYQDWHQSPRVIVLGIMDPKYIDGLVNGSGGLTFQLNNLAMFFLEGFDGSGNQASITGRFLYFVKSTGPSGPVAGSLIKKLQLVE